MRHGGRFFDCRDRSCPPSSYCSPCFERRPFADVNSPRNSVCLCRLHSGKSNRNWHCANSSQVALPENPYPIPDGGCIDVSTCTNIVDTIGINCKNAGTKSEYGCINWAAQGITTCSQWADQGSNQCTSWQKCHW